MTAVIRRLPRVLLFALPLVPFAAPPIGAQGWTGNAAFEVRVEDRRGKAVEGAIVALSHLEPFAAGGPAPLITDGRGRLQIGGLAPGSWSIEVRKEGFMSFRAEIVLQFNTRPEIVQATQHNVAGATGTMKVELEKLRSGPAAKPAIVRMPDTPIEAPPAPAEKAASERPKRTPRAARPTPQPTPKPVSEPAPKPTPVEPAPKPAQQPAPAPVAQSPAVTSAPEPSVAAGPAPKAVQESAPAPVAAPPVAAPAPAPAPPAAATAPAERPCFECRPGESAIFIESEVGATDGGACPVDLAERLRSTPLGELGGVAESLPGGCTVMRIDLPRSARYVGFRYEATTPGAPHSVDCFARQSCPGGGHGFPLEPIVRSEGEATVVFALFQSNAPRRAGFTVYWAQSR